MLTLFREGGVPMFAVLLFGLLALGTALRNALRAFSRGDRRTDRRASRNVWAFIAATVFATLSGVAADFAAVGHHGSEHFNEYRASGELVAVLLQGFAESMAPAILGFSLAALAAFVAAFGSASKDSDETSK